MISKNNKLTLTAFVLWTLCSSYSNVSAFQTPKTITAASSPSASVAAAAKATAAATLAVLLTVGAPVEPAYAADSGGALQIQVDQIPPANIGLNVKDIPVVGSIVSGTYTKLDAKAVKELKSPPSVVISSPTDKFKALKAATTEGHLEVDIGGKVGLSTHLDVDIAAEAGVAKIRVASPLIPPLPFKNLASAEGKTGGPESEWNVVTNMGSGESYYFNTKTGTTQYEKPVEL